MNQSLKVFFIFALMLTDALADNQSFSIHGEQKTCSNIAWLDFAIGLNEIYVSGKAGTINLSDFYGWNEHDFTEATAWASECTNNIPAYFSTKSFVAARIQGLGIAKIAEDKHREVQEQRAKEAEQRQRDVEKANRLAALRIAESEQKRQAELEARQKAEDGKKRIEKEKEKRIAECMATDQYTLYDAQETVNAELENIRIVKQQQAQERRIEAAGGVRDLAVERGYGEQLVAARDSLKESYAAYKKLGGKASSAASVTHKLLDPCATLRDKT